MPFERLREYRGPVTNPDIWATFNLRPDDIIVDTPPKCGTTWMLNIVMMLIHGRVVPDAGNSLDSPWLDCGFRDRREIARFLDALDRRRCIKSHTPLDGILFGPGPSYIVVYRHPVDVHFSLRTHAANMKNDWLDFMFSSSEQDDFRRFVDAPATPSGTDDLTLASLAHHFLESKARRNSGNVHFFHYADLTRDLRGQVTRLANILSIPLSPELTDDIVEATTFTSMRKAVEASDRRFHKDTPFHDLADFFHSGSSGKWEGRVSEAQMSTYARRLADLLPPEDIAWLEWGDRRAP